MNKKIKIGDFDKIMSDRNLFNEVVYTPLPEAIRLLAERENDDELFKKVDKVLNDHMPNVLKRERKYAVQFRQIATPNFETRSFLNLAKENKLRPLFFEYFDDKFIPENEFKNSLGKLHIEKEEDKNGHSQIQKITIVDFPNNGGKCLRDVNTVWNEPLVDFHRKLFAIYGHDISDFDFYDASNWLKIHGNKPVNYYTNFFLLLTCYGILFENFLLHYTEGEFSKNIVLPAIEKAMNITGLKPLIVPMQPTSTETDKHWISYDSKIKDALSKKTK